MARPIALLRAVNVGARKVPMAELRPLCEGLGWSNVETYIQSGNIVFEAGEKPEALEAQLEEALEKRFGFEVPTIIRTLAQWEAIAEANPFPEASEKEPNLVLVGVAKRPPRAEAARELEDRGANGERVVLAGGELWFHYAGGVGPSKLSPSLIDRLAGSPVTARNWRTVLKLKEMLRR